MLSIRCFNLVARVVTIMTLASICSRAAAQTSAPYFYGDWILNSFIFTDGERETQNMGKQALDAKSPVVAIIKSKIEGWRVGADGFCAGLTKNTDGSKSVWLDLTCEANIVSGSHMEIRATFRKFGRACNTVFKLGKIDPKEKNTLAGSMESMCQDSDYRAQMYSNVVYMRAQ